MNCVCSICNIFRRGRKIRIQPLEPTIPTKICRNPDEYCRVCFEGTKTYNKLVSPCKCRGTIKFIHVKCLLRWTELRYGNDSSKYKCEVCHCKFDQRIIKSIFKILHTKRMIRTRLRNRLRNRSRNRNRIRNRVSGNFGI